MNISIVWNVCTKPKHQYFFPGHLNVEQLVVWLHGRCGHWSEPVLLLQKEVLLLQKEGLPPCSLWLEYTVFYCIHSSEPLNWICLLTELKTKVAQKENKKNFASVSSSNLPDTHGCQRASVALLSNSLLIGQQASCEIADNPAFIGSNGFSS